MVTSLPRIIQERETREKLKREKAEVRVHDAYVNDKPLTLFRQREAKEKKEVCSGSSDLDNHTLTDCTGLQAEERERKEVLVFVAMLACADLFPESSKKRRTRRRGR